MENVSRVRGFNRYYTAKLGVLQEGMHDSAYTLTEARVLYELAQNSGARRSDRRLVQEGATVERRRSDRRKGVTAKELATMLGLDPGYLSRILKRFEKESLLSRTPGEKDKRQVQLQLTSQGRERFRTLDKGSQELVAGMLAPLTLEQQDELVRAMATIENLLEGRADDKLVLRSHRHGDIGWIVETHGRLYAHERKWGMAFEALVARISADFLDNFKPGREACWIAEKGGRRVGSVLLVEKSEQVAQLRLLLVEPAARGLGLGSLLVKQCEQFARTAGYEKIFLWTQTVLTSARKIYQAAGYRLVEESTHTLFGEPSKGESWVLDL